jgi:hypothetical protein
MALAELCRKWGWTLYWQQIDLKTRTIHSDAYFAITNLCKPGDRNSHHFLLEIERSKASKYKEGGPSILRKHVGCHDFFDTPECGKDWGFRAVQSDCFPEYRGAAQQSLPYVPGKVPAPRVLADSGTALQAEFRRGDFPHPGGRPRESLRTFEHFLIITIPDKKPASGRIRTLARCDSGSLVSLGIGPTRNLTLKSEVLRDSSVPFGFAQGSLGATLFGQLKCCRMKRRS